MSKTQIVYIGTYSEPILFGTGQVLEGKGKGIHTFSYDPDTGALEPLGIAEGIRNPSFLALSQDNRFLYAVNELKEFQGKPSGAVSAFKIGPQPWQLTLLNQQPTMGTDPCHVALDRTGRYCAVANFRTGSVALYPVRADGSLDEPSAFVQHSGASIDPVRQTGPHAHAVIFSRDNTKLLVPDLGIDTLVVYDFDAVLGRLKQNEERSVALPAGSGPRTLEFHPSGSYAYLINELNSTVTTLRIDKSSGRMEILQNISTLPEGFSGKSTCADIHIHPNGKVLYASNRGHDSLTIFAIDERDGHLEKIDSVPTGGRTPRHFAIAPDGNHVIAANQDTDNLVVFSVENHGRTLCETSLQAAVGTPVCVVFSTQSQ